MKTRFIPSILILVIIALLLMGSAQAQLQPANQATIETPDAGAEMDLPAGLASLPNAGEDWWSVVQEDIRQSEYHIAWQDGTFLADLPAAYQAPNRAHELRTYFTVEGIRVVPRVFDGDTPDWEWGLSLPGIDGAEDLIIDGRRVEFVFGSEDPAFETWQVNDEEGLKSGYLVLEPTDSLQLSFSGSL